MEQLLIVLRAGDIQKKHRGAASKQKKKSYFFTKYVIKLKVPVAGQAKGRKSMTNSIFKDAISNSGAPRP